MRNKLLCLYLFFLTGSSGFQISRFYYFCISLKTAVNSICLERVLILSIVSGSINTFVLVARSTASFVSHKEDLRIFLRP
jgi:hypothetical protein